MHFSVQSFRRGHHTEAVPAGADTVRADTVRADTVRADTVRADTLRQSAAMHDRGSVSPPMAFADISRLVRPHRVAVVGASDRPGSLGYSTYHNVRNNSEIG